MLDEKSNDETNDDKWKKVKKGRKEKTCNQQRAAHTPSFSLTWSLPVQMVMMMVNIMEMIMMANIREMKMVMMMNIRIGVC